MAVLQVAPAAARQAASLRAHREAAAQFERALRFAGDLPVHERVQLLESYAYECYLTDQHEAAISARRDTIAIWREENRPEKVGENLRWLSRLSWFVGRRDEAERAAEEAIAMLAKADAPEQLAWAYSNFAQLLMLAARNREAEEWARRALAIADEIGAIEITVHALNNLGTTLQAEGDSSGRIHLERSLQIAREHDFEEHVARALTNLTSGANSVLDVEVAYRYANEGIAYATDHDLDAWLSFLTACRAEVHFLRGDWDAAVADSQAMLARPVVSLVTRIIAMFWIGRVQVRRGDPAGVTTLRDALTLALPAGELQYLAPNYAALAEAAYLAGDQRRTAEMVRAIMSSAEHANPSDRSELVYWLWRAGEYDGHPSTPLEPFALQITGKWREAAVAWDDLGCPYEAARARAEGDDEDALRSALMTFEDLGARPMAMLTARRLRERGVRSVPRGPRPSTRANPAHLTARELEILAHLGEGRRNAEIAERLFLSPKTIEHHVGNILAKLGVRSRSEVVSAASRLGISLPIDQSQGAEAPR